MTYSVALVGTGADPDDPDTDGFAMAYRHARAYRRLDDCQIASCADIVEENARQFARTFDVPDERVFTDYETMLEVSQPDIVSVCVPPSAHADIVVGCAESGVVDAVHCEKPMAKTWRGCREMVEACESHGVQLTINHQRRFGTPFRRAKALLDAGEIGSLERVEIGGPNLYDYGSHLFDLCGYVTDQTPVEWVLGQIDYRRENVQFGAHNENQAVSQWRYEDGVYGLASTGAEGLLDAELRFVGSDGVIEVGANDGPALRMQSANSDGWRAVDTGGEGIHGPENGLVKRAARHLAGYVPFLSQNRFDPDGRSFIDRAIADVVTALDEEREPELAAEHALQAMELVFASWESARRRGRVDLPLDIASNPLEEMVESGAVLVEEA
jgi:predicted dehydrogenase